MSAAVAERLGLPQMVSENTDNHCTAFTVSIDHVDTTTGISAAERSYTMMKCGPGDKAPGSQKTGTRIPTRGKARRCPCEKRHTEATVDLMRLAGLSECGVCCEIMEEDGTMMRTTNLWKLAKEYGLKFITIKELQDYCRVHENMWCRRPARTCRPSTDTLRSTAM